MKGQPIGTHVLLIAILGMLLCLGGCYGAGYTSVSTGVSYNDYWSPHHQYRSGTYHHRYQPRPHHRPPPKLKYHGSIGRPPHGGHHKGAHRRPSPGRGHRR